jgi:hypothetical protein
MKNLIEKVVGTPFVSHVDQTARPTISSDYINNIFAGCSHSNFHNVSRYGIYKSMGYKYDFRPFLKKIIVKQYDSWQEYYAPNKTALRKCLHGAIQKMVYIQD